MCIGWVIRVLTRKGTPAVTDFGSLYTWGGLRHGPSPHPQPPAVTATARDVMRYVPSAISATASTFWLPARRMRVEAAGVASRPKAKTATSGTRVRVGEEGDAPRALGGDPHRHRTAVVGDLRHLEHHAAISPGPRPR